MDTDSTDKMPVKGKAEQRLEWHWEEPCWPASKVKQALVADSLTVYRCFECKVDFRGSILADLHRRLHMGQSVLMTVYPPAVGVDPKGFG